MKIKFKNILSYGNRFTEITFKPGIDIIVGKNGRGKSVLLDALNFALFGKPYRNIKINQLINNINNKELLVEFEFRKNHKDYKVIRGLKPSIFEIYENNKLLSQHGHSKDYQEMLETILGFNENIFKQLIALGTNLTGNKNFFEIPQREREKIFQKLTGTYIISVVSQLAKEKKNHYTTILKNLEYKLKVNKDNLIQTKNYIANLEKQKEAFIDNKEKSINKIQLKLNDLQKEINNLNKQYNEIDYANLENKLNEIEVKRQKLIQKKIEIETHLNQPYIKCPKCGYESVNINELKSKLQKVLTALNKINQEINDINSQINEKIIFKNNLNRQITQKNIEYNKLETKLNEIKNQKEIEIDYSIIDKIENEIKEIQKEIEENESEIKIYDEILSIVNDPMFIEKILNNYLPVFNQTANEYLEKYNLNYKIKINSKYKLEILHRNEEINYWQLSNGQKQRILLSILFSFIKLMEMNGFSFDILILDEFLDSSMDESGIIETINILKEFDNKDIIIITHNDKILNTIEADRVFEVNTNFKFSEIKQIR